MSAAPPLQHVRAPSPVHFPSEATWERGAPQLAVEIASESESESAGDRDDLRGAPIHLN